MRRRYLCPRRQHRYHEDKRRRNDQSSAEYANHSIDETAALLEKYDVFKAAIAKKAIPYCNVVFLTGKEMKEHATAYLQVLYDQNPSSIGGSLKEEMFYLEE